MHKPGIAWIERTRMFRFLKQHHQLHHSYMGTNFNVVLPLADWMLGTLLLEAPEPPKVTEPAARQVARRHSVWGRRLREGARSERTGPDVAARGSADSPSEP